MIPKHPEANHEFSEARFWRHLGWFIACKVAVLGVLWYVFFGPIHRVHPDGSSTSQHITGTP